MPYQYDKRTRVWVYTPPTGGTAHWYDPSDPEGSNLPLPDVVTALIARAESGDTAAQEQVAAYFDALNEDEPPEGHPMPALAPARDSRTASQTAGETRGVRDTPEQINTQTSIDRNLFALVDRKAKIDVREEALRTAYAQRPYGPMPALAYQPPSGGGATQPADGFPGRAPDAYLAAYNARDVVAASAALDARERALDAAETQFKARDTTAENLTDYGDLLRTARETEAEADAATKFLASDPRNDKDLRPRLDASGAWDYGSTGGAYAKARSAREQAEAMAARLWPGEKRAFGRLQQNVAQGLDPHAGIPTAAGGGVGAYRGGGIVDLPRSAYTVLPAAPRLVRLAEGGEAQATWGTVPLPIDYEAMQAQRRALAEIQEQEQYQITQLDEQARVQTEAIAYQERQQLQELETQAQAQRDKVVADERREERQIRADFERKMSAIAQRQGFAGTAQAQAGRAQQLSTLTPTPGGKTYSG